MKHKLRPEAEEDLTRAALWYDERRTGLGAELLEEVEQTLQRMEENPRQYPVVHLDIRRANVHRFPYSIYYLVHDEELGVLAVHHNSLDPRRWMRRRR